jgi:uncharacterized coiled-coil protein SlyX
MTASTDEEREQDRTAPIERLEVTFAAERMTIDELEAKLAEYQVASEQTGAVIDPRLFQVLRDWLESK